MGNFCQCLGDKFKLFDEGGEIRPEERNEHFNSIPSNLNSSNNLHEKFKLKNYSSQKFFSSNNNSFKDNIESKLDLPTKNINIIEEENLNNYRYNDYDNYNNNQFEENSNENEIENTEFIVASNVLSNNNYFHGEKDIEDSIDKNLIPEDDYSKYIFEQINLIRENPKKFIPIIEKSKSNIKTNKSGHLIYKSKVNVALNKGEKSFDEAINYLNNTNPMKKLIYFPQLNISLPENENEIKMKDYLKNSVNNLVVPVKTFFKDNIKDPETSFILMIVDDTGKKEGMKRKTILNPNLKFIGICSTKIGKSFACYLTFSNRLI